MADPLEYVAANPTAGVEELFALGQRWTHWRASCSARGCRQSNICVGQTWSSADPQNEKAEGLNGRSGGMAGIKYQGSGSHSRYVVGSWLATQPRTGVIEHREEATDNMTTATQGTAPTGPAGDEEGPLLRLRGVSKHFGPVQALTEVDLEIPAGQVTALAGDNGAGKSVMICLLYTSPSPRDRTRSRMPSSA